MEYLSDLLYAVPLLLLAGIIDGIAGGGGIIALPTYLLTGMPVLSAYACNKLQSGFGTLCSAMTLVKNKYVDFKTTLCALPCTICASMLATELLKSFDDDIIKTIIACCLPIPVVLMFLRRKMSSGTVTSRRLDVKTVLLSMLCGAILGTYDALFGPGGGTIAIMLFSILMSYDLRVGSGNGKIIIVASNLTAMISHIASGYMIWHVAIPCALANMLGSYIGAKLIVKKGEKLVFPTMLLVITLLIGQTILGFFM